MEFMEDLLLLVKIMNGVPGKDEWKGEY